MGGVSPPSLAAMPVNGSRPATIAPSMPASPDKLWKAAQDFEAMAIGELLQPMFDTVNNKNALFGGGAGEQAFKPMLVQEMAKKIAAGGGFGLAQPVYAEMLRMQEAKSR